jgi:hypothetical protein
MRRTRWVLVWLSIVLVLSAVLSLRAQAACDLDSVDSYYTRARNHMDI